MGGPADNSSTGAAWVYTRSGGVWTQQGSKLVGTGAVGNAGQGSSVALSADGNTAIVGGPFDNLNTGAAWVYTRSGAVWTQQGNKLVGTGAVGIARQGFSVALSADGNTAIVGGPFDNSDTGAAWVYHPQQGCLDPAGQQAGRHRCGWRRAEQGFSVALSADGNTAIVGGLADNRITGAAWVYTAAAVSGPHTLRSWDTEARLSGRRLGTLIGERSQNSSYPRYISRKKAMLKCVSLNSKMSFPCSALK